MYKSDLILDLYQILYRYFGPQHWWPARTSFEVMVGAILTQNTNWGNVEKAIAKLREAKALQPETIARMPQPRLRLLIRSSGFYHQKARRLKALAHFLLNRYGGINPRLRKQDTDRLRKELLSLDGIGPETADSILLYALNRPVFVIDAYTRRIFSRHRFLPEDSKYDKWQRLFMDNLPHRSDLFNEYHALIVKLAKIHCRRKPLCQGCPLNRMPIGPGRSTPDLARRRRSLAVRTGGPLHAHNRS